MQRVAIGIFSRRKVWLNWGKNDCTQLHNSFHWDFPYKMHFFMPASTSFCELAVNPHYYGRFAAFVHRGAAARTTTKESGLTRPFLRLRGRQTSPAGRPPSRIAFVIIGIGGNSKGRRMSDDVLTTQVVRRKERKIAQKWEKTRIN